MTSRGFVPLGIPRERRYNPDAQCPYPFVYFVFPFATLPIPRSLAVMIQTTDREVFPFMCQVCTWKYFSLQRKWTITLCIAYKVFFPSQVMKKKFQSERWLARFDLFKARAFGSGLYLWPRKLPQKKPKDLNLKQKINKAQALKKKTKLRPI